MVLNLLVLIGFLLNFDISHNIAFNMGKPGDKSKIKQLLVILGAPVFVTLFLASYLNGVALSIGVKTLLELVIILAAYIELHDLEKDYKDVPFGPDQVGVVIAVRTTSIMKHAYWIKVLTPNGIGVCFSDELEEVQI